MKAAPSSALAADLAQVRALVAEGHEVGEAIVDEAIGTRGESSKVLRQPKVEGQGLGEGRAATSGARTASQTCLNRYRSPARSGECRARSQRGLGYGSHTTGVETKGTNWGTAQPPPTTLWKLIHSRFPET